MISVDLQVRPAVPSDKQQIADLMFFEAHVHRHLDWRSPLEWLGSSHYWVMETQGRITAALACPQDPPGVAWVRFFTFVSQLSGPAAWSPLWAAVCTELAGAGKAVCAAIALKAWFQDILLSAGFELSQQIVLLEWTSHLIEPRRSPPGIQVRPMLEGDLPYVTETDAAAFEPLWHNSLPSLRKAFTSALCATVAEETGHIVGYQLSTGNPLGAHLARLAVRPEAQGRGIGSALVGDLILRLRPRNLARLSVNTQADNYASLALYHKLGFLRTGEQYPVFICPVGSG
jgi:ribosomal-protein-alanine N-acetyltransferase